MCYLPYNYEVSVWLTMCTSLCSSSLGWQRKTACSDRRLGTLMSIYTTMHNIVMKFSIIT